MKYLLIIPLILFIGANQILAAKLIEGTVPEYKPLQPAPEGVAPNYTGNIEYVGRPEEFYFSEQPKNEPRTGIEKEAQNQRHSRIFWLFGPEIDFGTNYGPIKNFAFLIFVLVLLGGGIYYLKREK